MQHSVITVEQDWPMAPCPACSGHGEHYSTPSGHANDPRVNASGCDYCDGEGEVPGEWHCSGCDALVSSHDAYCPDCEEVSEAYLAEALS